MPRGGRSRGRSMSPMRRSPSPRTTAVAPAPRPTAPMRPQQPSAVGQPRQPGLMGQMAATAGGVAVGSAVGHVIGSALTGGNQQDVTYQEPAAAQGSGQQQQQQQNPCQNQMEQFFQCTQSQNDIALCQGFNDAFRECKVQYGLQ